MACGCHWTAWIIDHYHHCRKFYWTGLVYSKCKRLKTRHSPKVPSSLMLNNFCVSKCDFAKDLDFSAQLVKTFFSLCLPNIAAKRFYMILLKKEVRIHSFTLYF